MGSLFAGRLALAGFDVTLVDVDPARAKQINADGLRLCLGGEMVRLGVPCVLPWQLAGEQDLVVLFTKFDALETAMRQTREKLAPEVVVAVLANGLGVAEKLSPGLKSGQLVVGVTDVAADMRHGIAHSNGSGSVTVGTAAPGGQSEAADRVADCLADGGFAVTVAPDIRPIIWAKVAFNAAFNALATIVDGPVQALDNAAGHRIIGAVLSEVARVALAENVSFDIESVSARIDAAFAHQGGHLPSMLQDRRAGRRTEIEAINGAIAARAQALGISAPVNQTLADLVRLTGG